jgi:hypothetical protein
MFDRLLLLASGGVQVYFGDLGHKCATLNKYFEALPGSPVRAPALNPGAWMLDVVSLLPKEAAVYFNQHPSKQAMLDNMQLQIANKDDNAKTLMDESSQVGVLQQYLVLQARTARLYFRDVNFVAKRIFILCLLGVIFGCVYFQLKASTQAGLVSTMSALIVSCAFVGIIHAATLLPIVFDNRDVYYREKASNMYGWFPHSIASWMIEVPYSALGSLCFLAVFYFMVGFRNEAQYFFSTFLVFWIVSMTYISMIHMLGAAMPNKQVAGIFQGVVFSLFIFFSGITISGPQLLDGYKFFFNILPLSHAMSAVVMPQFKFDCDPGFSLPMCGPKATVIVNQQPTVIYQAQFVQNYTGFNFDDYGTQIGWIILIIVVIRCLTFICLEKVSHIKR